MTRISSRSFKVNNQIGEITAFHSTIRDLEALHTRHRSEAESEARRLRAEVGALQQRLTSAPSSSSAPRHRSNTVTGDGSHEFIGRGGDSAGGGASSRDRDRENAPRDRDRDRDRDRERTRDGHARESRRSKVERT